MRPVAFILPRTGPGCVASPSWKLVAKKIINIHKLVNLLTKVWSAGEIVQMTWAQAKIAYRADGSSHN